MSGRLKCEVACKEFLVFIFKAQDSPRNWRVCRSNRRKEVLLGEILGLPGSESDNWKQLQIF